MENPFAVKMRDKSDEQLLDIIENTKDWLELAVLAAAEELEKRKKLNSGNKVAIKHVAQHVKEELKMQEYQKRFISKKYIYIYSLFLTPLFVGPFLSYNMWEIRTIKGFAISLAVSALFVLGGVLLYIHIPLIPVGIIVLGIYNLLGIVLIVELLWYKFIPDFKDYNNRSYS